jgi:hypothetical protein
METGAFPEAGTAAARRAALRSRQPPHAALLSRRSEAKTDGVDEQSQITLDLPLISPNLLSGVLNKIGQPDV